jgi:hypothetical protein
MISATSATVVSRKGVGETSALQTNAGTIVQLIGIIEGSNRSVL